MTMTTGTNTLLTLSTILVKGDFMLLAPSTSLMILLKTFSSFFLLTKIFNGASLLIDPPITIESSSFVIGKDSPLIIDSSTLEIPLITIPSLGIVSPGLTSKTSFI